MVAEPFPGSNSGPGPRPGPALRAGASGAGAPRAGDPGAGDPGVGAPGPGIAGGGPPGPEEHRPAAVTLDLELSRGGRGASVRIEIHDRQPNRTALLALHGGLDWAAVSRLGRALEDLAERGVGQVLLDCSHLDHIDYRLVPALVERLERFETRAGLVVCGLSHYVRDLFRLAGCDARLRCWPTASDLLPQPASVEPGRECAS